MKFQILLIAALCLSACATTQRNREAKEKWNAVLSSHEFKAEKEILIKRLNGANVCFELGVSDFFKSGVESPDSNCLYFSSKMFKDYDGEARQAVRQLKVLQVVPDGFVVRSPEYSNNQIVYIHKSEEKGIVDGAFLDSKDGFGLYRYTGPFSYQSLAGSNTVHSFKRLTKDEIKAAQEGLKTYGVLKEFFIRNELWDRLESDK